MSHEAWGEGWCNDEQVTGLQKEFQRYRFWRAHPRSYFVVNVDQDGATTLKLHPVPVEAWDKAYTADNVDAAIDRAVLAAASVATGECCCAIHHRNYGRCLQCPKHGLHAPQVSGGPLAQPGFLENE